MIELSGITWGHRRAIDPLLAASRIHQERTGVKVDWSVRSLGDFEHQPLHEAARSCDFVVFDHPFCGVIAASRCFVPLTDRLAALSRPDMFIGPSLETYRYAGEIWGAPVDGACNHAVFRRDLMPEPDRLPGSWDDVLLLGRDLARSGCQLAIGANSHHGLVAVAALCANLGKAWPKGGRADFHPDRDALTEAVEAMRALLALCPPECLDWNSIALHDAMAARTDLVYCPIVYGFALYGAADPALSFGPLPGLQAPFDRGGVIGGAAVGLSASSSHSREALLYLDFLLQAETQRDLFAAHSGQPARIEAWLDPVADARFGGYFSGIRSTLAKADVRPRFVGYQQFEKRAGDRMEALLREVAPTHQIVAMIEREAERIRRGEIDPPYDRLMALEEAAEAKDRDHAG